MPPTNPLEALAARWADAKPAERANAQSYIIELCEALGVERPRPAGSGYEFELAIKVISKDGDEATNYIDCWHAGHFALEAKDQDAGISEERLLRKAFGQVRNYVSHVPGGLPPFLMVLDVGKSLRVWEGWTGEFGGFHAARRIDLPTLAERPADIALLKAIWQDPGSLDPRAKAAAVTKEIAAKLAELAASLEDRGHSQEEVAQFLIRLMFTMFAEDVDLLPEDTLLNLLDDVPAEDLPEALVDLWKAMDTGKRFGGKKLARFNGKFFEDPKALPLTKDDKTLLILAAGKEWQDVEPSIFGTLMVRALDPVERHKLGAEFTPREYVERLVRPTVEEPIREKWTLVEAHVLQLRESGKEKDRKAALQEVRKFHDWLCALQILDPACGSGNFLYVTLHLLKRIELEVFDLAVLLGADKGEEAALRLHEVHPRQFHGIEVKPWAREIAELTLWIGYHQFWKKYQHVEHPEPILEDTETIECRDAVLAWDEIRHDPSRDRPDPTPRIPHPVTGELVPDPAAKLQYMEYVGPRQAEWPNVDFIVGNPPYMGQARQRTAFGDGYTEALRAAYDTVPDAADLVMYWWERSAQLVARGEAIRAGLITTNTIAQSQNRPVIAAAQSAGAQLLWVTPDHPWIESTDGAAVRVAMTVVGSSNGPARLNLLDRQDELLPPKFVPRLNADLTATADVATAGRTTLLANEGISAQGVKVWGKGFILDRDEADQLLMGAPENAPFIRPYRNGRDLSARPRDSWIIDFGLLEEAEARRAPQIFDLVRDRVKPERDANAREAYRRYWWRFAEPRRGLRDGLSGLTRYIATLQVSKHRFFTFLEVAIVPDHALMCIAEQDASLLGFLSSRFHLDWAAATGGKLGVGNDSYYNKSVCFDPYPFPDPPKGLRDRIGLLAEQLDRHRKDAIARHESVTMTGMYNVVEKLRSGESLTAKERATHEIAACGVLRDLHDELDAQVAGAYGWALPMEKEEVLERLVALHGERVAEEKVGKVRWLRPEYQIPRFGKDVPGSKELALEPSKGAVAIAVLKPWPTTAMEQLAAIKELLASRSMTAKEVGEALAGANAPLVKRHLETLELMGELTKSGRGKYGVPK